MENNLKVKVFTYINPKTWVNHPEFETIKDAIHITSTRSLKEGISECYQHNGNFKYIFSIKEVIANVFKEWNTPEYKLKQYLELSKIIEEISDPTSEYLKQSFKKNSAELLDTIEFLVWSGLSPDDLNPLHNDLSEKEKLFVQVWRNLEANDNSYKDLRDKLNGELGFTELMNSLAIEKEKPLLLHGFYYITPQQQKVLSLLQRSGRDIIFFQHYDSRFSETFGFMNKFISMYQKLTKTSQDLTSSEINSNLTSQYMESIKQYWKLYDQSLSLPYEDWAPRNQYIASTQQHLSLRPQYTVLVQQYFDSMYHYFQSTQQYFDSTEKYLISIEKHFDSTEKYLILRNHCLSINKELASISQDLPDIYNELGLMNENLTLMSQDLTEIAKNLTLMSQDLTEIAKNLTLMSQDLTDIYNQLGLMNENLTLIHNELGLRIKALILKNQNLGAMYQDLNFNNPLSHGQLFLSRFEDNLSHSKDKELSLNTTKQKLYKFDKFSDFLHEAIKNYNPHKSEENQICTIIATNADILNPLLVQEYPSLYSSKRNFLDYPVGQFILNIHKMYDHGELILNENILNSVFSSGWLYDDECNARDLTYQLKQIFPFFKGCNKFSEWEERMELLLDYYDRKENSQWKANEEAIKDLLSKLSYYSLKKEEVKKIQKFINKLQEINSELFPEGKKETSLIDYFKKFQEVLAKNSPLIDQSDSLINQENEIIKAILAKVDKVCKDYKNHKDSILYNDLKEALYLFLSGKFDEEENLIKPFIEIDGEIFKKHSNPIHLTGLDENGLPLSRFKTPWPLQDKTLELLSHKYPIIELVSLRNESIKYISRYLLYLALEFLPQNQLQLSWIANFLDKEDLKPCLYMCIQNTEIVDYYSKQEYAIQENQECSNKLEVPIFPQKMGKIESLIYNYCEKRWFYSFVTDSNPTYTTDLNHEHLFKLMVDVMRVNSVTKKIEDHEPNPVNDVNLINATINIVGAHFPQITQTRKQVLGSENLEFKFFSEEKKHKYIQNRKEWFYTRGSKSDDKSKCKYCEHVDSCPDGVIEKDTLLDANVKIRN